MNIKKFIGVIIFGCVAWCQTVLTAQDFIISREEQQKKDASCSKNELKSSLGEVTKHIFDQTTQFAQLLGKLQIEMAGMSAGKTGASVVPLTVPLYKEFGLVQITLAQMQERFSHLAEKLIENKKPFKKASRQQLTDALSTMQAIERALNEQEKRVRGVGGRFCKIAGADGPDRMTVLREFEHVITADRKAMQGFYDQLNRSECLKNS